MPNHAIIESCRIPPFAFYLEVSYPNFLLAWEITMDGKYDIENSSFGYEG